jgi:beta-glucosidase
MRCVRQVMLVVLALLAGVALRGMPQTPPTPPSGAAYLNPDLSPEVRAKDLVSRMTLEQKVRQMQNAAPAIPDLGVPAYDWWNEALHGVARAGQATVFPQAIGLAATWDTDLVNRISDVISTEARAKYNEAIRQNNHGRYYGLTFWSPNINIFRDPRWGRGQETYGEDPYLTGRLAVAFIKGLQGNDPKYFKTIATAKHYAVHSGPESTRHEANIDPSPRDLAETYLPAFRAAMVEGQAYSLMCAYNAVNGTPACANRDLLETRLRGDWHFPGYIVSDCGAIGDIFRGHKFRTTAAEASAAAVKAGTDLTCGSEYTSLVSAVSSGLVTEAEIDRSLERLFVARFRLGMFDPPARVPFSTIPYSETDSAAHRLLALEAARASIVLLKNDHHALPLSPSPTAIAVIGPSADDGESLLGNYNGFSSKLVTPLQGLTREFGANGAVRYALGAVYAQGSAAFMPADVFTAPGGSQPGVQAEYFDNATLAGTPRLSRIEPRPSSPNVRDTAVTAAGIPAQGWSARWTGTLRPTLSGEYTLASQGGASVHLFLDDQELVSAAPAAVTGQPRPPTPPIVRTLQAGRAYRFRVEYRPAAGRGSGASDSGGMQVMWAPPATDLVTEAVALAKRSAIVIACVGLSPRLEGEEMNVKAPGFSGGDRTDITLPEPQARLLDALFSTGTPVVVVLTSGSAVAIVNAQTHAAAILEAWYGGEEIGTAIADVIAGRSNPSGRLPVTFYRDVTHLPPFASYAMKGRTYRYFAGDVLYRFGFGLSYAAFAYAELRVDRVDRLDRLDRLAGGGLRAAARVTNTSNRDGDEVVQLYVDGGGQTDDPIRELRGFERVRLAAGQSREVTFLVDASVLPKSGRVRVSIGGGQPVGGVAHVTGEIR